MMTLRPIFCASMAQASPVGPAPMTRTSVPISGIGLAFAFSRVSSSSAVRESGMGLTAESVEATRVRSQLGNGDSSTRELQKAWGDNAGSGRCIRSSQGGGPNLRFNNAPELVLRNLQIVRGLKIQPKARAGIEVPREPQCRIWSNPAALVNDLGDSCYWYTEIERQTIHAQAQRFHEVRAQDLAGMDGRKRLLRFRQRCCSCSR